MVIHDINQALHYSDDIIAMRQGKIIAQGNAEEIVSTEVLKQVYDTDLEIATLNSHKFIITV